MSSQTFPITAAQLAGNFCETLFYGIYLVTFSFCVRDILFRGIGKNERWVRLNEIRWFVSSVTLVLFIINTFDVALGLLHNYNAFLRAPDPVAMFMDFTDWINVARVIDQVLSMIIGDFFLIYRCWIVYARRWTVVTPSITLFLANLSIAGKMLHEQITTTSAASFNQGTFKRWSVSFFAIVAVQNTLTTSIIVWRIWKVDRQVERCVGHLCAAYRPRHLRRIMRAIAESGGAYTLLVFTSFVVSVSSESNVIYPVANMTLQMAGIAFNVILTQSSERRDKQFTDYDKETMTTLMFSDKSNREGSALP